LIVLLLVFRTLMAAALPVGVGALAVVGGIGILMAVSHGVDISQYAINVCSLIGLGVAIDYSLFTVARYGRSSRRATTTKKRSRGPSHTLAKWWPSRRSQSAWGWRR